MSHANLPPGVSSLRVDDLPLTPESRQRLADLRADYVSLACTNKTLAPRDRNRTVTVPHKHDLERFAAWSKLSRFVDSLVHDHTGFVPAE